MGRQFTLNTKAKTSRRPISIVYHSMESHDEWDVVLESITYHDTGEVVNDFTKKSSDRDSARDLALHDFFTNHLTLW